MRCRRSMLAATWAAHPSALRGRCLLPGRMSGPAGASPRKRIQELVAPTTPLPHPPATVPCAHPRSGFTAKVAGTELGVTQPQPTFSPCYTSTSLVFHPVRAWATSRAARPSPRRHAETRAGASLVQPAPATPGTKAVGSPGLVPRVRAAWRVAGTAAKPPSCCSDWRLRRIWPVHRAPVWSSHPTMLPCVADEVRGAAGPEAAAARHASVAGEHRVDGRRVRPLSAARGAQRVAAGLREGCSSPARRRLMLPERMAVPGCCWPAYRAHLERCARTRPLLTQRAGPACLRRFGVGTRIALKHTRALVDAIHSGEPMGSQRAYTR